MVDVDTIGTALLETFPWPYLYGAGVALVATLRFVRGWRAQLLCAALILLMLGLVPLKSISDAHREQARADAAQKILARYCAGAGEVIRRRIPGVEGIQLQDLSPPVAVSGNGRPGWGGHGALHDLSGREHIETLLVWEHRKDPANSARGYLSRRPSSWPGYRYVDVPEHDGTMQRYRLSAGPGDPMTRSPIEGQPSPFVVSYANMTDAVDGELWIAGTKVWITDARVAEVIAERSWYSIERRDGMLVPRETLGGRATACPERNEWVSEPMRFFVDRVLLVRPAAS